MARDTATRETTSREATLKGTVARGVVGTTDATERKPGAAAWLGLLVVCLVSMLISLNVNMPNLALPSVTRHFQASASLGSWLLLSYLVTLTACLLACGRLTDLLGQRRLYLAALGIFSVTSLLCGFAPNMHVLIGLRVMAALGGAVLMGSGATLVHRAFAGSRLGHAMGLYTASFSVANLIGPSAGGAVVALWGWPWIFWFNVPLCVIALALAWWVIPRDGPRQRSSLDGAGNALIIVILVMIIVGISQVTSQGWLHPTVWAPLVVGAVLVAPLVWVERRSRNPVLGPDVLTTPGVPLMYLSGLLNGAARFPVVVLMSLYFQSVMMQDPLHASLAILPLPAATIVASLTLGLLSSRFTPAALAMAGSGLGMTGVFGLTAGVFVDQPWSLPVSLVLVGTGTGLFLGSNATALLDKLPSHHAGVGNAIRLTLLNTGNVVSLALALSILTTSLPSRLRDAVLAATASRDEVPVILLGFQHAFVFISVVALIGFLVSVQGLRGERATAAATTARSNARSRRPRRDRAESGERARDLV